MAQAVFAVALASYQLLDPFSEFFLALHHGVGLNAVFERHAARGPKHADGALLAPRWPKVVCGLQVGLAGFAVFLACKQRSRGLPAPARLLELDGGAKIASGLRQIPITRLGRQRRAHIAVGQGNMRGDPQACRKQRDGPEALQHGQSLPRFREGVKPKACCEEAQPCGHV